MLKAVLYTESQKQVKRKNKKLSGENVNTIQDIVIVTIHISNMKILNKITGLMRQDIQEDIKTGHQKFEVWGGIECKGRLFLLVFLYLFLISNHLKITCCTQSEKIFVSLVVIKNLQNNYQKNL